MAGEAVGDLERNHQRVEGGGVEMEGGGDGMEIT